MFGTIFYYVVNAKRFILTNRLINAIMQGLNSKGRFKMQITKKEDSSFINWTITSDKQLDAAECAELQLNNNYHPAGYNFLSWREFKLDNGNYEYNWKCYNSCD